MYLQKKRIFEEIDTLISNNDWIDYFEDVLQNRKVGKKDGWIDFENEISKIIQTLDSARITIFEQLNQGKQKGKMTQHQWNILAPLFDNTVTSCDSIFFDETAIDYRKIRLLNNLNSLIRCLEIYLEDYVEKITPSVKLPDIETLDINFVLCFNYTHTYERFYQIDKDKKIQYDYIHGEVKADSSVEVCNMILGIDEYLEGNEKNKDNEFIEFKKFYQRIYKKTGCKYVDWKKNGEKSAKAYNRNESNSINNVYIIGHSMDITDKDILSSLINMQGTKTTIFHHNKEALGKQISNLVKVLGEDELISKAHGSHASIVLQEQESPIPIYNK